MESLEFLLNIPGSFGCCFHFLIPWGHLDGSLGNLYCIFFLNLLLGFVDLIERS
jgi:hypothetical protein